MTIRHFCSSRVRCFCFVFPGLSWVLTHKHTHRGTKAKWNLISCDFTAKRKLPMCWAWSQKRTFQRRYGDRDGGERKEAAALWHSSDVCWAWLATLWETSFRLAPVHFLCTTTAAAEAEVLGRVLFSPWTFLLSGRSIHLCPSCSWISAICSSLLLQSEACKHVLTGHGPLQWHGVLAWAQSLAQQY